MRNNMIDKNTSNIVNMMRWLAALLVLISHCRYLVLVNYSNVTDKDILAKGFYFLTGFGHEAVVLFFVISGFLVGGISYRKWQSKINYKTYILDRFSRIYVVLVPALFIGGTFDYFGLNLFNSAELYTNSIQYHTNSLSAIISDKFTTTTFFGNLLMLQGKFISTFGSNNPLWSLSYEWWYYILFMLIHSFFNDKKRILVIPIILIMVVIPVKTIIWSSIWALGLLVNPISKLMQRKKHPFLIFAFLFIVTIFSSRLSHNTEAIESMHVVYFRDLLLGLACTLFLSSTCAIKMELPFFNLHQKLADFSYSTYLFHFPILIFSASFLYQNYGITFQRQPDIKGYIYFSALSLLMYLFSFLMYMIFEKNTRAVRCKLDKII